MTNCAASYPRDSFVTTSRFSVLPPKCIDDTRATGREMAIPIGRANNVIATNRFRITQAELQTLCHTTTLFAIEMHELPPKPPSPESESREARFSHRTDRNGSRGDSMTFTLLMALALVGGVEVTLDAGRVSIHATNASAADILRAWSTTGHVQIVNIEAAPTVPLTLTLERVTEADALEVLLRSSGGYLAIERDIVNQDPTASRFERVVVLRGRSIGTPPPMPVEPPPPPPAPADMERNHTSPPDEAGVHRILGADGQPVPDDQDGAPAPTEAQPR